MEDEVAREMDVYLTGGACAALQFPLRPSFAQQPHIEGCRLRPGARRMDMDVRGGAALLQPHASTLVGANANLCVGIVRDGQLHLSAVSDVFQMRPSFDAVTFDDDDDFISSRAKAASASAELSGSAQQVHVRPKDSDRLRASKETSYAALKKREEEEASCDLRVHGVGSEASRELLESAVFREALL